MKSHASTQRYWLGSTQIQRRSATISLIGLNETCIKVEDFKSVDGIPKVVLQHIAKKASLYYPKKHFG